MRTIDAALLAEIQQRSTRPLLLVEIGFSSPARLSSWGDLTWSGVLWRSAALKVTGFGQDGSGRRRVNMTIGNADSEIGALLLNQRIADRAVAVYESWLDADGNVMVMPSFVGVGSAFAVGPTECAISALTLGSGLAHAPREMICPANGFTRLRPPNSKFNWGGQTFVVSRQVTV